MTRSYDAAVIGSGQGGTPLAMALADAGWRTAVIEREHVGGTCINEGCTPTKTIVSSGRVAHLAGRGADYGVHTRSVSVDMMSVRERKRNVVRMFRSSMEGRLAHAHGLDLLSGEASFTGPKTLLVKGLDGDASELTAERIFINAGARPARPALEGLEGVEALDSTSVMELEAVPEHLLVLGGGYVGVEFGQLFRRFGGKVTIVQRGSALLGREDQDVADEVARILREDGVEIVLGAEPIGVQKGPDGQLRLSVKSSGEVRTSVGSHLLLAVGRVPNSDVLNLAAAGIQVDPRGFIEVNDRLETNVPGVYAIGDVKGGPAFTHISYDDFRVLRTNLLDGGGATTEGRIIPYTVFMDPQLGRIGLTEAEARQEGHRVRVARLPMTRVARALETGETRGFMKAVVDADTDHVLGASVLGIEGGEIMAMVEIAMLGRLRYQALRDAVFAHPTLAESLNNLFASFE
jgi:pyruvate/2-oxoglutarate dehydrogenase complex dihydrolipoamide dehydrogenase (E3) component